MDILRLLVMHGASVHETVGGHTLSMLNLYRPQYDSEVLLQFIRLLIEECYSDFDTFGDRCSSILVTAARNQEYAVDAVDLIAATGANINKIFTDGRSLLHFAAELSCNPGFIPHLFDTYGFQDVNGQDQWGRTPLHYALCAMSPRSSKHTREGIWRKIEFLLEKGGDP